MVLLCVGDCFLTFSFLFQVCDIKIGPLTPIPIFAQSVNVWNTSNSLWQLLASLWTCCFSKASIMLCSSLGTLVWLSFFEQYIVGVDSPNYILCDHEKRTQESKSKPLWVSFNSGASALRECAWINVIKRIRNKKSSRYDSTFSIPLKVPSL